MNSRTINTFVLAALGLALLGVLRPESPDPQDDIRVAETAFYLEKAQGDDRSDCVIIGDSRALRGFSPAVIGEFLPGWTVRNLAFNAGGMNDEMYELAERRLVDEGPNRTIVVALTPLALQSWKTANGQYHEYRSKPIDVSFMHRHLRALADFFSPIHPSVPAKILLGLKPVYRVEQTFHSDGWIESDQIPPSADTGVENLGERLAGNTVDRSLLDQLIAQVAEWSAQGIHVVGVRPPSSPEVDAVENEMLAFDQDDVIRRFRNAGGRWIKLPRDGWSLYDGSHLDSESARRASALLGEALASLVEP